MSERLSDARIQRFLATRQIAVLAMLRADGAPVATPMWFLPGERGLVMVSEAGAPKVTRLRRDPRASVVVEAGTRGDIRGVVAEGRVEFLADGAERRDLVERIVERYRPDLERRWGGRAMPADRTLFRLVPERVRSWGLG